MKDSNQDLIPDHTDWWMDSIQKLEDALAHLRDCAQDDLEQNDGVNHKDLALEVVECVNAVLPPEQTEEEGTGASQEVVFAPNTSPEGVAAKYRHVVLGHYFNHEKNGCNSNIIDMADRLLGGVHESYRSGCYTEEIKNQTMCAYNTLCVLAFNPDIAICRSAATDLSKLAALYKENDADVFHYIHNLICFVNDYQLAINN